MNNFHCFSPCLSICVCVCKRDTRQRKRKRFTVSIMYCPSYRLFGTFQTSVAVKLECKVQNTRLHPARGLQDQRHFLSNMSPDDRSDIFTLKRHKDIRTLCPIQELEKLNTWSLIPEMQGLENVHHCHQLLPQHHTNNTSSGNNIVSITTCTTLAALTNTSLVENIEKANEFKTDYTLRK